MYVDRGAELSSTRPQLQPRNQAEEMHSGEGALKHLLPVPNVCAENACTAKGDAAAWAALGCVVAASQDGTTVSALGAQTAAPGWASCAITCPTAGQEFAVAAVGAPPCPGSDCLACATMPCTCE